MHLLRTNQVPITCKVRSISGGWYQPKSDDQHFLMRYSRIELRQKMAVCIAWSKDKYYLCETFVSVGECVLCHIIKHISYCRSQWKKFEGHYSKIPLLPRWADPWFITHNNYLQPKTWDFVPKPILWGRVTNQVSVFTSVATTTIFKKLSFQI